MTIDEIRKGAPKDATHYDNSGDYWKVVNKDRVYFYWDEWIEFAFTLKRAMNKYALKPL